MTPPTTAKPIKVLVSWAHKGEGWSEEATIAWQHEVMTFTMELRQNGIDADIDLFYAHDNLADWTRFGQMAVEKSDYVLVAITEAWAQRWSGTNKSHVGAGVAVEADTLKGLFNSDQLALQKKLKIVVLGDRSASEIPHDMARIQRFSIDVHKSETYDDLLRTLTEQPFFVRSPLGNVPVLSPAVVTSSTSRPPKTVSSASLSTAQAQVNARQSLKDEYNALSAELKIGMDPEDTSHALRRMSSLRKKLNMFDHTPLPSDF
ncbi:hypothetical protein [Arthrobacter sp. lap29]|uniref:hypothetical protein n=1 Tax=Arthrobacter sp. lap29 TaxID=3056122 RepID=UPI0028F73826|nr:hypothetical protein [Arthrobacter sp. lap29]